MIEEEKNRFREDAEALGCVKEIAHLKTIMETGTSAHRQLSTYAMALGRGVSQNEALTRSSIC